MDEKMLQRIAEFKQELVHDLEEEEVQRIVHLYVQDEDDAIWASYRHAVLAEQELSDHVRVQSLYAACKGLLDYTSKELIVAILLPVEANNGNQEVDAFEVFVIIGMGIGLCWLATCQPWNDQGSQWDMVDAESCPELTRLLTRLLEKNPILHRTMLDRGFSQINNFPI